MIAKRIAIILWVLLCLTSSAWGAPRKHWYRDPKWYAQDIVTGLFIALDAHSTVRAQGLGAVETNSILGRHPATSRVALYMSSDFVLQTGLSAAGWHFVHHEPVAASCSDYYDAGRHRFIEHCTEYGQDNLGWRTAAYVWAPAAAAYNNLRPALENYEIKGKR